MTKVGWLGWQNGGFEPSVRQRQPDFSLCPTLTLVILYKFSISLYDRGFEDLATTLRYILGLTINLCQTTIEFA
ncbi:hypothetical protein RB195_002317 [Necator americanus]|uniref:Uncharacterized protein n=1 Tax=Necator americanus TaxID=51031 RepID=A0ABR1DIY0_NECAM